MINISLAKFGTMMSNLTNKTGYNFRAYDTQEVVQSIIDMVEPAHEQNKVELIDALMKYMVEGTHKIDAIKCHRSLTGFGLKESKDAVEKYWISRPLSGPG